MAAAVSNDDNSSESYNTISNNYINGGVEGIHFNAPASEKGNIIKGNTFYLTKRYGILASFQDSLLVENNNVQMPLCEYGNGINVNNGLNADTSYIINNFVSISGTMGVGLYSYDNTLINIYNNSIEGDVTSGSLSPAWTAYIYSSKAGNSHVYNNVFYNGAGEMAIVGNSNAITSSDYNDIASTGSFLTYWNGAYYNTLSAWQKAAGKDAHSLSADPAFYDFSMGDLHLTDSSHALFTAALYLSDVPKDIDGQQRHKKPSIGADEYVPLDSNDVGVSTLILPANNSCGSDSTIISLRIKNHGASDQTNSFNVHLDFTGISISPIVIPIKGTLKAGKDSLISIYMNTSKGGKFSVKSYTDLKNDSVHGNDTAFASINFYSLPDASFKFISMGGGLIDFTPSDSTLKSYNWNFGDASANGITKKPSHTYSNGRYQVSLTTKNNNSCTATWSDSLIINFTGLASVNVNLNTLDISPNPFSNSTTISYTLAKTENVKIEVYNMLGVHLYTLIDTRQTEGTYSIKFSLEQNRNLSSGIYLIKITRDGAAEQKQAIMTR